MAALRNFEVIWVARGSQKPLIIVVGNLVVAQRGVSPHAIRLFIATMGAARLIAA